VNVPYTNLTAPTVADSWAQDHFEPMYAAVRRGEAVHSVSVLLLADRNAAGMEQWFRQMGPGVAVLRPFQTEDASTYNGTGNIESFPGPDGKNVVVIGRDPAKPELLSARYTGLLKAQGIDPLYADTSWSAVSHVDEILGLAPASSKRGWKLLVASPTDGLAVLQRLKEQGKGGVNVFSRERVGPFAAPTPRSIDAVLADPEVQTRTKVAQNAIDAAVAALSQRVGGLAQDEIVKVPVLVHKNPTMEGAGPIEGDGADMPFLSRGGSAAPGNAAGVPASPAAPAEAVFKTAFLLPNAVNGVLHGTDYLTPTTFGPVIDGKDAFAAEVNKVLSGAGLKVHSIDTWFTLHQFGGDVHCGTNALREVPTNAGTTPTSRAG